MTHPPGAGELRASLLARILRHEAWVYTVVRRDTLRAQARRVHQLHRGARMRPNKMKQVWREGRCVTMGWLSISNGFTAEVMARQGFDALVVDMQHGLTDMANLWT